MKQCDKAAQQRRRGKVAYSTCIKIIPLLSGALALWICIYMLWSTAVLARDLSDETSVAEGLQGSYKGESDELSQGFEVRSEKIGSGGCWTAETHEEWTLILQPFPGEPGGNGSMSIEETLGEYTKFGPTAGCLEAITGSESSKTAIRTSSYNVLWRIVPGNLHRLQIRLIGTDCSGVLCGRLKKFERGMEIYSSGDLMYHTADSR